ncbi:aminomethyltransferase family protein [Chloroflexota bacterium]
MKIQTPFYSKHLEYNPQWLEAPGFLWQLPAVYTSLEKESLMVRERVGFIDYSLQYTLVIAGRDAFNMLQKVLVNDLRKISPGRAIYSTILNEAATAIDDIVLLWLEENLFLMVGVRKQPVYEWLKQQAQGKDVYIIDAGYGLLALQGPKSRDILQKVVDVKDLTYYSHKQAKINDIPVLIARIGFTGELGYELYVRPEYALSLWDTVMELGKDYNIAPYGLNTGAVLALEKGYLRLVDFYEGSTPLELGFGWTVAFDKGDFIGKDALLKKKNEGLKTKLMGFEVPDPKIVASAKDNLIKEGKTVGQVTRAGYGFALKKSIGLGWVEIEHAKEGEDLELEHEGKRTKIKLANRKWYDPENKKLKG